MLIFFYLALSLFSAIHAVSSVNFSELTGVIENNGFTNTQATEISNKITSIHQILTNKQAFEYKAYEEIQQENERSAIEEESTKSSSKKSSKNRSGGSSNFNLGLATILIVMNDGTTSSLDVCSDISQDKYIYDSRFYGTCNLVPGAKETDQASELKSILGKSHAQLIRYLETDELNVINDKVTEIIHLMNENIK